MQSILVRGWYIQWDNAKDELWLAWNFLEPSPTKFNTFQLKFYLAYLVHKKLGNCHSNLKLQVENSWRGNFIFPSFINNRPNMNLIGADDMQSAVMRRNGDHFLQILFVLPD